MGKNGKGGKKNAAGKKADPKVAPDVQPNESTHTSNVSNSQDLVCAFCAIQQDPSQSQWFVQCDECDQFTHFFCAGITEISEEEQWLCHVCVQMTSHGIHQNKSE